MSNDTMPNQTWSQFLISQGAEIAQGRVLHYAEDARAEKQRALNENILCDLSHYGLIRITGDDAEGFLQNQFCNDVRLVDSGQSQYNGYCNPKGRLLAFFRLLKQGENFYLRLPREVLEANLKRLRMYVLMSKVMLEDVSDERVYFACAGPDAEQVLKQQLDAIPSGADEVTQQDGVSVIRCGGTRPCFEILATTESARELWEKLAAVATPVGYGAWELLEIQTGIPEILPQTVEAFVPQMVNLQAIDALSFKKGCYPGQEIVARMHYLGKLKRRMYLAHVETDSPPAAGDNLYAEGSESGQGVGKVVRAESSPGGGVDLLAVIEISSAEQRVIRLNDVQGPQLQLLNLPYSFDEAG